MPFQAPWRNYQNGDLLYGLAAPRENLADQFGIGVGTLYTIDQYDTMLAPRPAAGLNHDANFLLSLVMHPRYHHAVDYDLEDDNNWQGANLAQTIAVARRKCKGGLQWVTQSTTRHIHFCLDGIDLVATASKNFASYNHGVGAAGERPVGKAPLNTPWRDKIRSITGEELRWVYRFRNNPRVRAQVQFWKPSWITTGHGRHHRGYIPCPPPWSDPRQPERVRAAWAAYVPIGPAHTGITAANVANAI